MFSQIFGIMLILLPILGAAWLILRAKQSRWRRFVGAAFVLLCLVVSVRAFPLTVVTTIGLWQLIVWGTGRRESLSRSRLKAEEAGVKPRGMVERVDNE